jgi:hypothetical protein
MKRIIIFKIATIISSFCLGWSLYNISKYSLNSQYVSNLIIFAVIGIICVFYSME